MNPVTLYALKLGLTIAAVVIFGIVLVMLIRLRLTNKTIVKITPEKIDILRNLGSNPDIHSLISKGESTTLEFKETFELDKGGVPKNMKAKGQIQEYKGRQKKALLRASIEGIVGFLNADGGVLLIGVNDQAEVTGMQEEIDTYYQGSKDKFLLRFEDALREHVGASDFPHSRYINSKLTEINSNIVFRVNCKKIESTSKSGPIFLHFGGKEELYVRRGPSTEKLTGKALLSFSSSRFPPK